MKTHLRRYPLFWFFSLAFLFSCLAVIPRILNPALPVEPFLILGGFAGPTLSSLIVILATEGRIGLKPFFKRYVQWRAGIFWWLLDSRLNDRLGSRSADRLYQGKPVLHAYPAIADLFR